MKEAGIAQQTKTVKRNAAPKKSIAPSLSDRAQPDVRTLLVASCGWPTEADVPVTRAKAGAR